MDEARALESLEGTISKIGRYQVTLERIERVRNGQETLQGISDDIREDLVLARAIADLVAPELSKRLVLVDQPFDHQWAYARDALVELRGRIRKAAEVADITGPVGPRLAATALHPVIWHAATPLWDSGYRPEAVAAAAKGLNAHLQARLGRQDTGETDLVQQAFSTDAPQAGRPRLRLRSGDESKTAKSLRAGVKALGEACFLAIRNPAAHDPVVHMSEPEALEMLACLSRFARWVDEAELLEV